jgi:alkyl hydroperoxide reductase subunit AhpC
VEKRVVASGAGMVSSVYAKGYNLRIQIQECSGVRGVSDASEGVKLSIGDKSPDFDLPVLLKGVKGRFRLHEWLQKKSLVLAFYPLNWEESSAIQLVEYQAQRERYVPLNAELVTVSVDSIMNTTAWEREIGPFDFPMCSDFWPHGEVCKRYGVFQDEGEGRGAAGNAIFVIDQEGTICFQKRYATREPVVLGEIWEVLNGILKGRK